MYFSSNKIVYLLNIGGQLDFFSNKVIELKKEGLPVNDFDVFCATRVFFFIKHMIFWSLISIISFFLYTSFFDYKYSNEYFFNFSFVFIGVLSIFIISFAFYVYKFYHHYTELSLDYIEKINSFDFSGDVIDKSIINVEDEYLIKKSKHVDSEIVYFYKNIKTKAFKNGEILQEGMVLNIEKSFVDFFSFTNKPLNSIYYNYFLNRKASFVLFYVVNFLLKSAYQKNEFNLLIASKFFDLLNQFLENNKFNGFDLEVKDFLINSKESMDLIFERLLLEDCNDKVLGKLKGSFEIIFSKI